MFPDDLASAAVEAATTDGTTAVLAVPAAATCGAPIADAIGPASSKSGAKNTIATISRRLAMETNRQQQQQQQPPQQQQQLSLSSLIDLFHFLILNGKQFLRI